MRILLTGSSGRIGTALWPHLAQQHEVVGFDRVPPPTDPPGPFHEGDVRDRAALADAVQVVDAIAHLAAIPYDIPPLPEVFDINMVGLYNVLDLAQERGIKHVAFTSSVMAYGFGRTATPQYLPVDEEHPALSIDTYGQTKLLGEQLCRAFTLKHGVQTICFRLTAAMWPGERYHTRVPFHNDDELEGLHCYIDVRDIAGAIEAGFRASHVKHDVFMLTAKDSGHADPTPTVIQRFFSNAALRYGRLEPTSPLISSDKMRRVLDFVPRYSWRDGPATTG